MIFHSNGTVEIKYNIKVYPVWKISPLPSKSVGKREPQSILVEEVERRKNFWWKAIFHSFHEALVIVLKSCLFNSSYQQLWNAKLVITVDIEWTCRLSAQNKRTMTEKSKKHRDLPRLKIPSFRRNSASPDPTLEESSEGDESSSVESAPKGRKVRRRWDYIYQLLFYFITKRAKWFAFIQFARMTVDLTCCMTVVLRRLGNRVTARKYWG